MNYKLLLKKWQIYKKNRINVCIIINLYLSLQMRFRDKILTSEEKKGLSNGKERLSTDLRGVWKGRTS